MTDPYARVVKGKLKLQNEIKKKHKKKKAHKRICDEMMTPVTLVQDQDVLRHGGWWRITKQQEVLGSIALEVGEGMSYVIARDDGLFSAGETHGVGESPGPEEIFTAMCLSDNKVALKSGYNKYMGVSSDGRVVGRLDAVGDREQWQVIFQEGKTALLGCNSCFLSVNQEGNIVCSSLTAGDKEMLTLRSCMERESKKEVKPPELKGSLKDVEINYVKKFQSFQDRRLRISNKDVLELKRAKKEGKLNEELLNRREKMKADRYCK